MAKYKSFITERRKLEVTHDEVQDNSIEINLLESFSVISTTETLLKAIGRFELENIIEFKDLYNFTGVTFTTEETQAVPEELYDFNEENGSYTFNLPVFAYPVNVNEDPNETIGGSWEKQTTIVKTKSNVFFPDFTDKVVSESKVISYLYIPDNSIEIPETRINIDPIKDIYAEYNNFYRWIKKNNGYNLEYHAFFPYPDGLDLKLKTIVVINFFGDLNAIQTFQNDTDQDRIR